MTFDLVLFDLDGTLTDSLPGITRCLSYALERVGLPQHDLESLRRFVGPPLYDTFAVQFGLPPAEAERAIAFYRERYGVTGMFENEVFPGIPELLAQLQRQSRLVLATSKATVYAERILEHFSLAPYFTAIIGSYLDGRRTDKADIVRDGLAAVPGAERAVMAGDRQHDIIGAHANHIPAIGAAYGYAAPGELEAVAPEFLAHSVAELHDLLLGA